MRLKNIDLNGFKPKIDDNRDYLVRIEDNIFISKLKSMMYFDDIAKGQIVSLYEVDELAVIEIDNVGDYYANTK